MARTGVIYGESGTYKTASVKEFALWIYEKTGLPTLLLSFDGGGWGPAQPFIDAGIVRAWRPPSDQPISYGVLVSKGYWPEGDGVGATGVRDLNFQPIDWTKFGGLAVEGLTSISQAVMRHLANKNIKTGEEATSPFQETFKVNGAEAAQTFAGNSRGHYGFVQNYVYTLVTQFSALPCEYVLFTALESRTEDDDRSTIYGPQVAGKKATALVPSWVGDCIHAQAYPVPRIVEVDDPEKPGAKKPATLLENVVRYHYVAHPDPSTGIRFPAKPRVPTSQIEELGRRMPGGYFEPRLEDGEGFARYLRLQDELNRGAGDAASEWRRKVDAKFGRGSIAAEVKDEK